MTVPYEEDDQTGIGCDERPKAEVLNKTTGDQHSEARRQRQNNDKHLNNQSMPKTYPEQNFLVLWLNLS